MKVTPRLPVHGKYTVCDGFIEMRYFRLSNISRSAAILFGVFELLRFPIKKQEHIQFANALSQLDSSSVPFRVLKFLLSRNIPQHQALAVWSEEAFYHCLISALRQILYLDNSPDETVLMAVLGIANLAAVRFNPGLDPESTAIVYMENGPSEAILLYHSFAKESLLVTVCGHIHVQSTLFAKARQRMEAPMTLEQFHAKSCLCEINGCTTNLSDAVFAAGKKSAEAFPEALARKTYQDVISGAFVVTSPAVNPSLCRICQLRSGESICREGCIVCSDCVISEYLAYFIFACPVCQSKIGKEHLNALVEKAEHRTGWTLRKPLRCEGCGRLCEMHEFRESLNLSHRCVLCMSCLEEVKRGPKACPACQRIHHFLKRAKAGNTSETGVGHGCAYCQKPKGITGYRCYLHLEHSCFFCDSCYGTIAAEGVGRSCSRCSLVYSRNICEEIATLLQQADQPLVRCSVCRDLQKLESFSLSAKLSHWWKCKVCDTCFQQRPFNSIRSCPRCNAEYASSELKHITDFTANRLPSPLANAEFPTCLICEEMQPQANFELIRQGGHQCDVCTECVLASQSAALRPAVCPQCRQPLRPQAEDAVRRAFRGAIVQSRRCLLCSQIKQLSEMRLCMKLCHLCNICDQCFRHHQPSLACPQCKRAYNRKDRRLVCRILSISQAEMRPAARRCRCGKEIPDGSLNCTSKCQCLECWFELYLAKKTTECPNCLENVNGFTSLFPQRVKCSGCLRDLTVQSEPLSEVAGVCPNGCILCPFCIKLDQSQQRCLCRNCLVPIHSRGYAEIQAKQHSFALGCYCGDTAWLEEQPLSCNHKVHKKCSQSVYTCRVCDEFVSEKPRAKTVLSYLYSFT